MNHVIKTAQVSDLRITVAKVNRTALVCTIVFGLRFISWLYGSLLFDLEVIPLTDWMLDIDQVFYPTVHYTLPDVVPDVVLLLLLSPNEKDYQSKMMDKEFDEDEEGDVTPIVRALSSIDKRSSGGSINSSRVDQDDEERIRSRQKYQRSGRTTSLVSEDSFLDEFPKEASTLLDESAETGSDDRESDLGSRHSDTNKSRGSMRKESDLVQPLLND